MQMFKLHKMVIFGAILLHITYRHALPWKLEPRGTFIRSCVCPFIHPTRLDFSGPKSGLSNLKSGLSNLKSGLLSLKSDLSGLKSALRYQSALSGLKFALTGPELDLSSLL